MDMDPFAIAAKEMTAEHVLGNVTTGIPNRIKDEGLHDEIRLLCPEPTTTMGDIWDDLGSKAQNALIGLAFTENR